MLAFVMHQKNKKQDLLILEHGIVLFIFWSLHEQHSEIHLFVVVNVADKTQTGIVPQNETFIGKANWLSLQFTLDVLLMRQKGNLIKTD